jgi:hypothetical protein
MQTIERALRIRCSPLRVESSAMKPSNVCFTIAATIMGLYHMLFDLFGGFETIEHNAMTGEPALLSYTLAAGAAFIGWRMRKDEQSKS